MAGQGWHERLREEKGATVIEYALLAALLGTVIVVSVTSTGVEIKGIFATVAGAFGRAEDSEGAGNNGKGPGGNGKGLAKGLDR